MTHVSTMLTLAALVVVAAGPAFAQSGQGHSHQHGVGGHQHGGGSDTQAHQRVEACLREFDQVVADGRGFGLAFPADQNGYPGPLHVLELKDRLQLTAEQESQMRVLFEAMLAEARSRAARLAAAEARLKRLFAERAADDAAVRTAVAETETARAEVRLAHLLTHLHTRDLLTEAQRQTYHQLRWGTPKNH
jgi:Spy/CpxP family protein refolding chaperone